MTSVQSASDINLVAGFLACSQLDISSPSCPTTDCIVICVSAVLHGAETVFRALQARPSLTKTLVLCGGIGHSTSLLYDSVARNPQYQSLAQEIVGLPEARVLEKIMHGFFDVEAITRANCRILIEDKSTNCGANASETRKLMEEAGLPPPKSCIVVQDPTMSLRTLASFQKTYEDLATPPSFFSCPTFVPKMAKQDGQLQFAVEEVPTTELWDMERFLDLIMGRNPQVER